MNKIVRQIGATFIGLLSIIIPAMTVVANINKWSGFAQLILFIGDICEFAIITASAYERSEDE